MAKGKYHEWLTQDGLTKLSGWARQGLTDEQIAGNIGITPSTLYDWKGKYPEISEALKKGKDVADFEVENALYRSALGYQYQEETREPLYNPETGEPIQGEDGKPLIRVTKVVTKQVQPNPTSIIYWLNNRKPDTWRNKRHEEITGTITTGPPLSEEEVQAEIARLEEELGLGQGDGQDGS